MSSFLTPLVVEPLDGRRWRIAFPFRYHVGSRYSNKIVVVPPGAVTDFASFPLWRLLFWWLPYWAKYSKPSPIHDELYRSKQIIGKPITRKRADEIFLEAMLVAWKDKKLGKFVAYMEYIGVRLFGWLVWH